MSSGSIFCFLFLFLTCVVIAGKGGDLKTLHKGPLALCTPSMPMYVVGHLLLLVGCPVSCPLWMQSIFSSSWFFMCIACRVIEVAQQGQKCCAYAAGMSVYHVCV